MKSICILHDNDMTDGSNRELERWFQEASLDSAACNIMHVTQHIDLIKDLHAIKPVIIVPLASTNHTNSLNALLPSFINKRTNCIDINKWRGSLLCSTELPWEHYVVPAFTPGQVFKAWDERQNAVLCFAKIAEEYNYWRSHGTLNLVPQRQLIDSPSADDCIDYLTAVLSSPADTVVSIDIENIGVYRGKYKTPQRNRVPYVIGFSIDPLIGMSIGLAEYNDRKTVIIWSLIDRVLREKCQVGQNYYTHDLPWMQYLGFSPDITRVHDTLVRHHTLWPELSHKLDYQTFQYTREPYYKDEGKNWTVKEKAKMKRYNCKDVCVTLEIYNEQEKEFRARA